MSYSVATLTTKGTELLAAATVSDRLVIVGCDADTTVLTQVQAQAIENRPASPTCTTTEVTSLSVTTSHIMMRIYFNSDTSTGGNVNSLYIYGHLESAPSTNYVIYVVSNATAFHLPTSSDVINEWEGVLEIAYTLSPDSVEFATQSTYCSVSEFNLLKNRVVTTHSENSTTHGEDQDIYGYKTFKETVTHEDSLEMFSNINFQNEDNSSRNSGRWGKEEHVRFLQGCLQYGNNWKKVETYVKTRTSTQIRSHAQKYLKKIDKKYLQNQNNSSNDSFSEEIVGSTFLSKNKENINNVENKKPN